VAAAPACPLLCEWLPLLLEELLVLELLLLLLLLLTPCEVLPCDVLLLAVPVPEACDSGALR
jgi:hypothetical protein